MLIRSAAAGDVPALVPLFAAWDHPQSASARSRGGAVARYPALGYDEQSASRARFIRPL